MRSRNSGQPRPRRPKAAEPKRPNVEQVSILSARQRVPLALLGSLVITGIGQTLLYALLPLASRELAMSGVQSSSVFALSALLWSLSSPFWGRLADRARGVTVLVMGMAGQGVSNLAVGITIYAAQRGMLPHPAVFPLLLALRGINGILGSAVLPSAQSLGLRSAPNRPRISVVGTIATSWTLGTMTGPGFAALLAPLGLASPLLCAAFLSFGAAATLGLRPAAAGGAVVSSAARPWALRMIRRRIWGFMLMQLGLGTANALVAQSTGFFVQDRLGLTAHGSVAIAGAGLSAMAACSIAAQILAIRLRPASHTLMIVGALAVALAAVGVILMPVAFVLVPALGVVGAGLGIATLGTSTAASLLTRAGQQGAVAGSLTSAGSLGAIVSALAVMPFYERIPDAPLIVVSVLAAIVAAGAVVAPRKEGQGA
jgi:MFS family permease